MSRTFALILSLAALPTLAAAEDPLHPLESVCVRYETTGPLMNGETVRCHRAFGWEQYEVQDFSISMAGITQTQRMHSITVGDTIYNINTANMTATKTTNPFFAPVAQAVSRSSPEEMGQNIMQAMGFRATGQIRTIAGHECEMQVSPIIGTACMTADAVILEQELMGLKMTATRVEIDQGGGEDAMYTLYKALPVSAGPDLSDGIGGLLQSLQGN
jgi:hypothetical protein